MLGTACAVCPHGISAIDVLCYMVKPLPLNLCNGATNKMFLVSAILVPHIFASAAACFAHILNTVKLKLILLCA